MTDPVHDADLVPVLVTGEEGLFLLAKSVLDSEGIEFLVRGENPQDQFGGGRVGTVFNLVTGPAELLVRTEDADRARALLNDLPTTSDAAPEQSEPERSGRPLEGEFAPYASADIDAVEGDDGVQALRAQADILQQLFDPLDDALVAGLAYADGKWTLKQVLGHLIDDERIFTYRALCLARGDTRPLPGFDENEYMRDAGFEGRALGDLLAEYRTVRQATLTLLEGLPHGAWLRRGTVNGYNATVRGLAFHIAGHELHHIRLVRERYLPLLA